MDHETRGPPTRQKDVYQMIMVGATGKNAIVSSRLDNQSERLHQNLKLVSVPIYLM
jgi:hypothetical protein